MLGDIMLRKIIVDGFGGDNSPEEIVKGCVLSLDKIDGYSIIIAGNKAKLENELSKYSYDNSKIEILDAGEVITNNESPTVAIRSKKDSSIVRAFDELRTNDETAGFVSAGSTGAVLTGAFLKLGRIKGISRPATCPLLPTEKGSKVAIIDSGANVDCKPINLIHFAIMANALLKDVLGVENPRIALLNVGTEDHKGNALTTEVFSALKEIKELNFVGNMEARDLLSGKFDIVVCDGFDGNVMLKASEGAVVFAGHCIKKCIKESFLSKIGALFMKKSFKSLKKITDYNKYGGALLLGCKKIVVKCHGSSKAETICGAIYQVKEADEAKICEVIEKNVASISYVENSGEKND